MKPQSEADCHSSAPVMVMWPIQISTIETQPTVSWVTLRTRQDSTNAQPDQRTARSDAVDRVGAPGRPDLEQHGQHGVGAEEPRQQGLRSVGALDQPQRHHDVEQHLVGGEHSVADSQGQEALVLQGGRRDVQVGTGRHLDLAPDRGQERDHHRVDQQQRGGDEGYGDDRLPGPDAERHARRTRTERVADVAGRRAGRPCPDALVAREDLDPVDVAGRATGRLDRGQQGEQEHERREARGERPGEVEQRLDEGADHPQPLRHPPGR